MATETKTPAALGERRHELIARIPLSITTVFSAWSAFQVTKWRGEMSVAHSSGHVDLANGYAAGFRNGFKLAFDA